MQVCCNMGARVPGFSNAVGLSGGAASANPGKGDVGCVQLEAVKFADPVAHLAQQSRWQVENLAAATTLSVQMGSSLTGQMIGRRAMPQMDVLDDTHLTERDQRPVDAGSMHLGSHLGNYCHHFVHAQVRRVAGQGGQNRSSWPSHSLAFGP